MKEQRILMGMPVTIEIAGDNANPDDFERLFSYFQYVDDTFSPHKATSETTRMNKGLLPLSECSEDMRTIVRLAEQTRRETNGYFNLQRC